MSKDTRTDPLLAVWVELEGHFTDAQLATADGIAECVRTLIRQRDEARDAREALTEHSSDIAAWREAREYAVDWIEDTPALRQMIGWLDGRIGDRP